MFGGPQVQNDRGQFIHFGDGAAVPGKVDGLEIDAAGVARFDADVRKLFSGVDGKLFLVFFAAVGTQEAAILPFGEAEAAEQKSLAAVAFRAEDRCHGLFSAERTMRLDACGDGARISARSPRSSAASSASCCSGAQSAKGAPERLSAARSSAARPSR